MLNKLLKNFVIEDSLTNRLIKYEFVALSEEIKNKFLSIKNIHHRAILAGGAIRDTYYKVPVKDIDIFVGPSFLKKIDLLENYKFEREPKLFEEYRFKNHIQGILTNKAQTNELPIQIIIFDHEQCLWNLISRFDWGFCQIGTYDTRNFYVTQEFVDDHKNNRATFIYDKNHDSKEESMRRAVRLMKKYKDRNFFVPLSKDQMKRLAYDADRFIHIDGCLNFVLT